MTYLALTLMRTEVVRVPPGCGQLESSESVPAQLRADVSEGD